VPIAGDRAYRTLAGVVNGDPIATSDDTKLSWVAWSLLAAWSAAGLLFGGYELIERIVEARPLAESSTWHSPFPVMLGPSIWLLWLLATIHLAPAGLIVGLIAVTRKKTARGLRAALLPVLVVGAAVAELAAPSLTTDNAVVGHDFVHDGRLAAVVIVLTSLVLLATTYWVLPHLQRRAGVDA
jgi:hypothetical protein